MTPSFISRLALSALLLLTGSLPALAADQPNHAPDHQLEAIAANAPQVTDLQLRHFAAAYRAVSTIRKDLLIETHAMDDKAEVDKLQKKAEGKMKAAILAHMTLGEYVRIGKAINADPALRARFMQIRASADEPPAPASG